MTGYEIQQCRFDLQNKLNKALNNLNEKHKWYNEDITNEWIQAASDYMNLLIKMDEFLSKDYKS